MGSPYDLPSKSTIHGSLYTILGIHRHILGDDDDAWDVQSPKRIWHRSFRFHETILSFGEPRSLMVKLVVWSPWGSP